MELRSILDKYKIVGVVSNYNISLNEKESVKNILKFKNNKKLLQIFNLDEEILDKKVMDLSLSDKLKIDLLSKSKNEIIVIGGLSTNLIYKDRELVRKFLLKMNNDYNKKIVIIDNDIGELMNIAKYFIVLKEKEIVYKTSDVYDDKLYKHIQMPEIISFIKSAQKKVELLNYTDTYELIKAIYRSI